MADWLWIREDGTAAAEEATPSLAARAGRYAVLSSAPDLLVGARVPAKGGTLPAGRAILCGDLEGLPFADLVGLLAQGRKTGVLRVLSPSADRTLVFAGGELRGASSTHPGDRLGEIAVRLGLLAREALEAILAEPFGGRRLGRLLVERRLLTEHDLWRAIQHQVSSIFKAMLLERQGAFVFSVEPVQDAATAPGISAQGLLMDGLRQLDELGLYRKRIPENATLRVAATPESTLAPEQREILRRLGERPLGVSTLAAELRLPEHELLRHLFHLDELGLVKVAEEGGPQSFAQVRPTASLQPIVRVFNQIYREIFAAARRQGGADALVSGLPGALGGEPRRAPLFQGAAFRADGTLDEAALLGRAEAAASEAGAPPRTYLLECLQEVMFFLLFTVGEHLPKHVDEELNRRVKLLFGMLEE